MATATWIKNELDEKGLPYEELQHEETFTAQGVAHKEHVSGHRVAKVVVVMADGKPVELILPATRRVALDRARMLLGADHIRMANEAEMREHFSDCELGAMPAWRHWPGVEVLMDQSLEGQRDILFQAGTHRDAVRMRFQDWFEAVRPTVGQFTDPCTDWMQRHQ